MTPTVTRAGSSLSRIPQPRPISSRDGVTSPGGITRRRGPLDRGTQPAWLEDELRKMGELTPEDDTPLSAGDVYAIAVIVGGFIALIAASISDFL